MGLVDSLKNANPGFLSAMKGANNAWGRATGSFMGGVAGYIGPKNFINNTDRKLMVSGSGLKDPIVFGKEDVERIDTLFATSEWIKYRIVLKDGKNIIATIFAVDVSNKGKEISMNLLNFEDLFADIIYK